MNIRTFYKKEVDEHKTVMQDAFFALEEPFMRLAHIAADTIKKGRKILFFGNGGSAADAQHLATELVVRYTHDRKAIPAIALTTDSSALTAAGNDFGFNAIFSRQIEALGHEGDLAIGISTSGESPNILNALTTAKDKGLLCAAFTGKGGGKLHGLADPLLIVPSSTTARIQEVHIFIGHILCNAIERILELV